MNDYTNAEWVVVQASPSVTDNQTTAYYTPLFREWVEDGWQVMSVTVLRRPKQL